MAWISVILASCNIYWKRPCADSAGIRACLACRQLPAHAACRTKLPAVCASIYHTIPNHNTETIILCLTLTLTLSLSLTTTQPQTLNLTLPEVIWRISSITLNAVSLPIEWRQSYPTSQVHTVRGQRWLGGRSVVYAPSELSPYIPAKPFTRCQYWP